MKRFWKTRGMRLRAAGSPLSSGTRGKGCANAFYGVADYVALPLGMLLAAPFLLRHLGTAQYGVWILASATVSSGGIVSGRFGDAVINHVGDFRGQGHWPSIARILRSMISLTLFLIVLFYIPL